MSFYLWIEQAGNGCYHTISCGTKCVRLEADNKDEAIDEAITEHDIEDLMEEGHECYCDKVRLLKVESEWDLVELLSEGDEDQTDDYVADLEREIEQLKSSLEDECVRRSLVERAMQSLFGSDIVERAGMPGGLSEPSYDKPELSVERICTKAIDARASQLAEPKISAKKKIAADFLERLSKAKTSIEHAEIMQEVTNVLKRIAK